MTVATMTSGFRGWRARWARAVQALKRLLDCAGTASMLLSRRMPLSKATLLVVMVAIAAAALAGCGGIDGKIEASCDAQVDLERVLQEEHGGAPPEQTQEECVRELQMARKEHERDRAGERVRA